jgi:hypothetical protein
MKKGPIKGLEKISLRVGLKALTVGTVNAL